MMHATKGTDLLAAQERIARDARVVAKLITEFILDFSAAFVAKHFSITTTNKIRSFGHRTDFGRERTRFIRFLAAILC